MNPIELSKMFPIELSKIEFIKNIINGGGFNDSEIILNLIKDNFNYIKGNDKINNNYYFIKNDELNNKEYENIKYISSGFYSTTIAINPINETAEIINGPLVIKLLLIKERKEDFIRDWNERYYNIYNAYKEKYKNLIADCYFYGNNIYKNNELIKTVVNNENKQLVFNIFKYYSQQLNNFNEKKIALIKLSSILLYFKNNNKFIFDLKYKNISFDDKQNIILIDFSENLIENYKENSKYKINHSIDFGPFKPAYLRKILYNFIKYNLDYITSKIDNNSNKKQERITINKIVSKIINNKIKDNINNNYELNNDKYNKYFTINNDIFKFNKFNSFSICEILLHLFFKKLYYKEETKIHHNINTFVYEKNIYDENDKVFIINDNISSVLKFYTSFNSLNNVETIRKFIYEFIEPLDDVNQDYCVKLKYLIFDPETETGLLAPDYDDIPSYELIFSYLNEINDNNSNIFNLYETYIKENIGDDINIENTFQRNNNYREWANERKRIKENRDNVCENEESLIFPPVNTKFKNYFTRKIDRQWVRGLTVPEPKILNKKYKIVRK